MANYSTLKAAVADVVKTNGTQAITGANLQTVLLSIINSVGGGGYIFKGVATPSTDAGTPDQNVFYVGGAGTYANFGTSVTVPVGSIGVFKYNGSWVREKIDIQQYFGISLITTGDGTKPNIDTTNNTLDLGDDPILLIHGKSYAMRAVWPNDTTKYRNIPFYDGTISSSAIQVVFNVDTHEFYMKRYNNNLSANEVLIGGVRLNGGTHKFVSGNFPFEYTIDGKNDIEILEEELNKKINVSLITPSENLPNIDIINNVLDLGTDPILLIGTDSYILRTIWTENPAKYRSIDLTNQVTGAVKFVFNLNTLEFSTKSYLVKLTDSEVLVGAFRLDNVTKKVLWASLPFDYTVNGCYQDRNVYLISSSNDIPNIDTATNTLDLGDDPVLIIGGRSFLLKTIWSSDSSKYRNIQLFDASLNSTALKIVFNTTTHTFYPIRYNVSVKNTEVIVGSFRVSGLEQHIFHDAYFPFNYTLNGRSNTGGSTGRQLNCKTGMGFIAHRGMHLNNVPENSLDAYRYAGYCNFDYAETDFCPTSDGVLVLMHDGTINRTMRNKSDYSEIIGDVVVNSHTYADLAANYVLASSDVRYRRPIPTLEEYFVTCRDSGVFPIPEIKTSGTTQVHVLNAFEMGRNILGEDNFGFCSFSYALLDYARSLSDKIKLYYIGESILGTNNTVTGQSRETSNTVWYPGYSDATLTKALIDQYHERGMKVAVWTTPVSEFDNMMKIGVDVIATDTISANIDGKVGNVATSNAGFGDFATNGTISNNSITLSAGQTITFTGALFWLGGYYLSVIGKGQFTISAPYLNVSVAANDFERFIYQGLVANATMSVTITATAISTIQFIDVSSTELS